MREKKKRRRKGEEANEGNERTREGGGKWVQIDKLFSKPHNSFRKREKRRGRGRGRERRRGRKREKVTEGRRENGSRQTDFLSSPIPFP
jgi:hypothetical protein